MLYSHLSPQRKMGGLLDTSKKPDFCVLYIALWLSQDMKKAARISLYELRESQNQVLRDLAE